MLGTDPGPLRRARVSSSLRSGGGWSSGTPIPKERGIIHTSDTTVSLPDLARGDQFAWVVLGDGAHVPFDPPVEAKVTFSVTAS
ncbi:MAG: hypothetical protein ACYDAD_07530 [Acidimicrobiales bacterium]